MTRLSIGRSIDLRFARLTCGPVDDPDGLPRMAHEELLARRVVLAHDHIQLAPPHAIPLAEQTLLVAIGTKRPILLLKHKKRHALALELSLNLGPVRNAPRRYASENPAKPTARVAALLRDQWQTSSGIRRQFLDLPDIVSA